MKAKMMQLFIPVLALYVGACTSEPPSEPRIAPEVSTPVATEAPLPTGNVPYRFESPDVSFALPEELMEISGLTVLPDGHLGAVQDEEGILFALNHETGAIEARYPFGNTGDYEGIETVDDRVFILMSNGNLLELTGWSEEDLQIRTFETDLKGKNDTEGLGYDPVSQRLLIACKEDPGKGLDKNQKAVYAFDPARSSFVSEPAYVLNLKDLEALDGKSKFKSSALAVHPSTGDIYLLSSVTKSVAVLSGDGNFRTAWQLPEKMFEQPEGLAFLPDGTLFISSEGVDGPGMLYQFSPTKSRQ